MCLKCSCLIQLLKFLDLVILYFAILDLVFWHMLDFLTANVVIIAVFFFDTFVRTKEKM
jgi:hypothetical protein